jgi:hypothetical protein
MDWSRRIALGVMAFSILVNTALLVEVQRARGHLRTESGTLRKQADALNQLSREVKRQSDVLVRDASELDKKTAELNALVRKGRKSLHCFQFFIPLPPTQAPQPAREKGPRT